MISSLVLATSGFLSSGSISGSGKFSATEETFCVGSSTFRASLNELLRSANAASKLVCGTKITDAAGSGVGTETRVESGIGIEDVTEVGSEIGARVEGEAGAEVWVVIPVIGSFEITTQFSSPGDLVSSGS